jgi:ABC-type glycerol-3-phosphate transport system substrate-binding protein
MRWRRNKPEEFIMSTPHLRHVPWLAWALILAGLVAAQCAAPSEVTPPPVAASPVAVSYMTWLSEGDLVGRAERSVFKQFEASQSRITVSPSGYYLDTTRDHLTVTTPPDVLLIQPWDTTLAIVREGLVLDVTSTWKQLGFDKAYPPQYVDMAGLEGKEYYIPLVYSWTAIFYNKAIFDQYQLAPPATWEEFLKVCDVLKENGVRPIALTGKGPWLSAYWFDYLDLRLNGPEFHARLIAGEERYDSPQIRRVLETWQSLQRDGYFVTDPDRWSYEDGLSAIIQGDDEFMRPLEPAAMLLANSFFFNETPPKFLAELDFFPFPTIDPSLPKAEVVDSLGYVISARAAHPSQAMEFTIYMNSVPAQSQLVQQMKPVDIYLPAQSGVEEALLTPGQRKARDLIHNADTIGTAYYASIPGAMRGEVEGALGRFFQGGDVDKALADLEAARRRIYGK